MVLLHPNELSKTGWTAVGLFFVLAGLLLTRIRIGQYILRKWSALRLRADMLWLTLRNHFGRSAISVGGNGPIVSLTTYGRRANTVYLVIESIARGSALPSRLILWLDDEAIYTNPPASLLRLKRRGLEIKLCKNYGPHSKYYPYVESQSTFTSPLVTADDDIIYPSNWIAGLLSAYDKFPQYVNCHRARVMVIKAGSIAPYREWPLCESTEASYQTIATGVSGVIYPTTLLEALKSAGNAFEVRCPKADDLWLHVQAIRSGFKVRQIKTKSVHFSIIPGTQENSLYAENCAQDNGNDRQLVVTYDPRDLETLIAS
jgi:hypothetical protein